MGVITYEHISISGVEYERILDLSIQHNINTHSYAKILCEVTSEQGKKTLSSLKVNDYVMISYRDKEETGVIFYGVCQNKELKYEGEYHRLNLELASTSILLDQKKENKTFQNSLQYISDIMNAVANGRAIINFNMTDRAVNELIIQKDETAWQCIKRLASHCNTVIIANITTQLPVIDVGRKQEYFSEPLELYTPDWKIQSFEPNTFELNAFELNPFELNTFEGKSANLWSGMLKMEDGILTMQNYMLKDSDFVQEKQYNSQISGLILTGIVEEVEQNKVKIFFDQIDESYDSSTNKWFEYSTAYASNGGDYGSGIYFMPEIGDRVRVFFPNEKEDNGVAFASEIASPLPSEKLMNWKSPGGQEILFTEQGISITGKEGSIFIELIEDDNIDCGVQIFCDKNINIVSESDSSDSENVICLKADRNVTIYADDQIKLETNSDKLEIDKKKICFTTENLYLMDD